VSQGGDVAGLTDAIVQVARALPAKHALEIADDIAEILSASSHEAAALAQRYPHPTLRDAAEDLVRGWRAGGSELPGSAVALALRAAASARSDARGEQRIDPVWSGPETPEIAVRRTREALIEVVRAARHRLIVVAFAAYKVQAVVEELRAAAQRNVDIRLVLETSEDSAGYLSHSASGAFADLRGRATFWVWPGDRRPPHAKLHAKAAIADRTVALVGSANLTDVALGDSMELGVLVRGGPLPALLSDHFLVLMDRGDLRRDPSL